MTVVVLLYFQSTDLIPSVFLFLNIYISPVVSGVCAHAK